MPRTGAASIVDSLLSSILGGRNASAAREFIRDLTSAAGGTSRISMSDINELMNLAGIKTYAPGPQSGVGQLAEAAGIKSLGGGRSRGGSGGRGRRGNGGGMGGGGEGTGGDTAAEPLEPYQPGRRTRQDLEATPWSHDAVLTPQSSNVYSFGYDKETSTLYVTFKAHELGDKVTSSQSDGGRRQLHGKAGATVGRKTNAAGAMYAYLDVPQRVFVRFMHAASKGKFVWDELRIRGSIYGHQYRYQLVHAMLTEHKGHRVEYVPRKATRKGFRVRSNAEPGVGRRSAVRSALSAQEGFSSRRSR